MWKISNILSLSRIILTLPTVYLLLTESWTLAVIIGAIAGLTDFFDGYLARKLNEISETGKILDPLADKLFIAGVSVTLLMKGLIPVWFVCLVLVRDFSILIAGLVMKNRLKSAPSSNLPGKITFFLIIMAVLVSVIKIDLLSQLTYFLASIGIVSSSTIYFLKMRNALKK